MDNKENTQDLNLDDILNEFHDAPGQTGELPVVDAAELSPELAGQLEALDHLLEELPELPQVTVETKRSKIASAMDSAPTRFTS